MSGAASAHIAPPEALWSGSLRTVPVSEQNMQPALRAGLDFVIIAPVTTFEREGIYAFSTDDTVKLYRCRRTDVPLQFILAFDNPVVTAQVAMPTGS